MKDDHLVAASSQSDKVRLEAFDGGKEIGEQHEETAFANELDDPLERRSEIGGLARGRTFQRKHQSA